VRAHNSFGWGLFSNPATFVVADVPAQPAAVTTSISGMNVMISWSAPSSNYATIDSYKILMQDSSGSNSYEDSIDCNGANSAVINSLYCLVPIETILR
jgi:hypothetical protein